MPPEPYLPPVRFAEGSDDVVEGLAIPFGGPFRGNADIYRTRFDTAELHLDWFPTRPVLYDHGQDPDTRAAGPVVGAVATTDISDYDDGTRKGKWVRAQLDRNHEYFAAISELVVRGALGWSHGTIPYLVDMDPPDRAGVRNVREWPVAEFTLTPVPANPDAFAVAHWMRSADRDIVLEILGTTEDAIAVRGWLPEGTTEGDLDDGDFAWVGEVDGKKVRKLPYKIHGKVNEAGWKAAWSRVHQDGTDFAGGPSQADTIKKLLADAPEGVDTKYNDGKTPVPGGRSATVTAGSKVVPANRAITTFSDLVAADTVNDQLPEALMTLQDAIWSAMYAYDADGNPETPDAKKAAIAASLEQFSSFVTELVDSAQPAGRSLVIVPAKPFRAGARNSASDQGQLDTAHASGHQVVESTFAAGAACDDCAAAHQSGDEGNQANTAADDGGDDDDNDGGDAATGRSADLGPVVFTVMSDVEAAVRAAALERAEQVGKEAAASLRRR